MRMCHFFFSGMLVAVVVFFPFTTDAARGRVKIGVSSKGALTVLSDRGTLLRGKDVWLRPGAAEHFEAEKCYADVRDAGLNMIHLRCENDFQPSGVRAWELPEVKAYIDNAVDWCDKYGLYVIAVYSNGTKDGVPDPITDGRLEFSEYMLNRYKDRTHFVLEPSNEAYQGDAEIDMIKHLRAIAPQTHLIMFTSMCTPSYNDAEIVNAVNKGIDFSNISVGYHMYCGRSEPANLEAWKNAGLALIMTEYFDWPILIADHEAAGISWALFFKDNSQSPGTPYCNFVNTFPGVMTKAIQKGGATNVCWLPDYGLVPGCNTPTGPYIQLSESSISSLIAKGASALSDTITASGANMGTSTLANITTSIAYASGGGWLSISRLGSGNQQQLVNVLSSASLPAGTYNATVTVTAASLQQATYSVQLTVVEPRTPENPPGSTPGLAYSYYEGSWTTLPTFAALTAKKSGTTSVIDLSPANASDNFGLHFTGYITVPTTGTYTFTLTSDDGSNAYIGSQQIINNDGIHADQTIAGSIILGAGKHAITVEYFEATGGQTLSMTWQGPGFVAQSIPASVFSHDKDVAIFNREIEKKNSRSSVTCYRTKGLEVRISADGAYAVQLFDWEGRQAALYSGSKTGIIKFEENQLRAGMYLVRLTNASGVVSTTKILLH